MKNFTIEEQLAMYLEAGWSDYLFAPMAHVVDTGFFRQVMGMVKKWSHSCRPGAQSICDIGGATGRALFEADLSFKTLDRLVLIEPVAAFCHWARMLLSSETPLPDFPVVGYRNQPCRHPAFSRPTPIASHRDRLLIYNGTIEKWKASQTFDIVLCLNVIDRHPEPRSLVNTLKAILHEGSILVLASPLDFQIEFTPDRESWLTDLNQAFGDTACWRDIEEKDLLYEFRLFNRSRIQYTTQVVAKQFIG